VTDHASLRSLVAAFKAHDLDQIMSFFADDCVLETPRGSDAWGDSLTCATRGLRSGTTSSNSASATVLRRKIDAGIARGRFGIVVLSKPFFAKGWQEYELDGLVTMSMTGRQILLPLWHEMSKDEVVSASPSLADKVALRTADYTVEEIASEIASVVGDDQR